MKRARGYTLAELLVTAAAMGIAAAVAIPSSAFYDSQKLAVAAEEVANAIRFAHSEAVRSNSYILVDAKTAPGELKVFFSDANANNFFNVYVTDQLTKRSLDVAVGSGAFSAGVTMAPQFMQGGTAYSQLLIDGSGTQWQAFDGPNNNRGALSSGSGVTLSYGGRTATVSIDPASGRVTIL